MNTSSFQDRDQVPVEPVDGESATLPRPALLAGDKLVAAVWLALLVVTLRVCLQSAVDFTGPERLRETDLWEHAVEHLVLAATGCWVLVAVLTLLPLRAGWLGWVRMAAAVIVSGSVLAGYFPPESEEQYRPALSSSRGVIGWVAIMMTAASIGALDAWVTRPRRRWWRVNPLIRLSFTALVLLASGAVTVAVQKRIEYVRRFIYVQSPQADFLDMFRRGEFEGEGVELASVLPGRSFEASGGNKPSLAMAPGSYAQFEVDVPASSWLSFSYAANLSSIQKVRRHNDSWDPAMRFRVTIDGSQVFDETLEPVGNDDDRRWFDSKIDLDESAGRRVTVRFSLDGSGNGNGLMQAGFGRPLLVRSSSVERSVSTPDDLNVVLVVVDSLRRDHLGCYGYEKRDTTPFLDELAKQSLLFERASSTSSWVWPATASLLTGRAPPSHGVVAEDRCFLSDHLQTLPELLQKIGMSTAGWTNSALVSQRKNFTQGFEIWGERPHRAGSYLVNEFTGFVRRRKASRFFAYLHFSEPSAPYAAPPKFRGLFSGDAADLSVNDGLDEEAVALALGTGAKPPSAERLDMLERLYDEEIAWVDHLLSRVRRALEEAEVWDRTLVIVTSSHGEEFCDHGGLQHGWTLHSEVLQIPLIYRDPRLEPGRSSVPVDLSGLPETILAAAGASLPSRNRTQAFPLAGVDPAEQKRCVFAHTQRGLYSGESTTLRWAAQDERFKLMLETDPDSGEVVSRALYDLDADPGETRDVLGEHQNVVDRLQQRWTRWLRSCLSRSAVDLPVDELLYPRFLPHLPGGAGSRGEGSGEDGSTEGGSDAGKSDAGESEEEKPRGAAG